MMYGWHYQDMGGGWWVLMIIGMVIFWGLLVFGLVALSRTYRREPIGATNHSAAVAVLQERFARGELTEEEYTRRLVMLKDQQ